MENNTCQTLYNEFETLDNETQPRLQLWKEGEPIPTYQPDMEKIKRRNEIREKLIKDCEEFVYTTLSLQQRLLVEQK